jgi:2-hydroxymuconate-semialdehyde hydrolase
MVTGWEERWAPTSGGRMAYVDMGDGRPVVLLHGFPTNSLLWQREAMLLASRLRVIVPDLLGYGASEKPEDADISAPAQARYVSDLVHHCGIERFAVVGHDLGGAVAQLLALGGRVEALVLLDTGPADRSPIAGVRALQAARPDQESPGFVEEVVRLALDRGIARASATNDALLDGFIRPWRADPAALFRAARGLDGGGPVGLETELSALDIPVFIVWGEEDPYFPPDVGERLGELIPGSMVALLPGCSHFVNLDAPQTVGPLIFEFLRTRYLGERHRHAPDAAGPVPVFLERPPAEFLEAVDGDGRED